VKLEKITARGVNNLYRHPKTGIIYFRKYQKGAGEIFRSTRKIKLEDAKSVVEQFKNSAVQPRAATPLLALELYDEWVESKRTLGKSKNTITSLLATRKHIESYFEFMLPDEITSEWWTKKYIPEIRAKTHLQRKFANDCKWINSFTLELHRTGRLTVRHALKNPDIKTTVGKNFSDEDIAALIHHAQNDSLRLAILMAATMGMRRLEIFALRKDRVDARKRVIRLRDEDTKIRKARSFAVSAAVWEMLKPRLVGSGPWVFPSSGDENKPLHKDGFKTAWTNLRKITDVQGRFHDLRHSFLTRAFKAEGANAALICHYAGLSLEVAQKVYLHFDEEDTRAVAGLVSYA
jgi:integrase